MDFTLIVSAASGLVSIITALTLIKNMLASGEKGLDQRLRVVEDMLRSHDRRIQSIEGDLKHLPDRETTHRLELAMAGISGRLDTMEERLKPIQAVSERLEEVLMEQARRAGKP